MINLAIVSVRVDEWMKAERVRQSDDSDKASKAQSRCVDAVTEVMHGRVDCR